MWGNKSDFFLIVVSKGTRGTELPAPFLSTYIFNFSFILGIFTRESYSPEQSTHIILKADVTPSLRVLL
jgi:hypothetical protein